jgi:hypothetical protein
MAAGRIEDVSEPENDDDLVVEVDGEGVHLNTLDAPSMLELAGSYFALLQKLAEEREESIDLVGLRAFEKCGSIATRPSDPELARQAALDAHRLLSSWSSPPRGLVQAVQRVRTARAALPSHYTASVKVRGFVRALAPEPAEALHESPYETLSLRAQLMRVGGRKPRAAFKARAELRPFSLDLASEDQAKQLGPYLYKRIDLVAVVVRDAAGNIEAGTLKEFEPLSGDDPARAWREWFRDSGVQSLDAANDDDFNEGEGRGERGSGS